MSKSKVLPIVIFSVLVLGMIMMSILYFTERNTNTQLNDRIDIANYQRDSISFELNQILYEYDKLKVTSNERYQRRIEEEEVTIKKMLDEIQELKTANRRIIRRYKKQVGTLRKILKGYIHTVDSLNTLTKVQQAEIAELKGNVKQAKTKNKKLSKKFSKLSDRVTEASQLEAVYLKSEPVKKNGKVTKKARKTKRIKTSFIIKENVIAKKGTYIAHIIITAPTGEVLSHDKKKFKSEGKEYVYSSTREVEYDGMNTKVEVWWETKTSFVKGTYKIEAFFNNRPVGETEVLLK